MVELWVFVERIIGACSGPVTMQPDHGFLVRDGRLLFPQGRPVCLFSLQTLLPLLPAKERRIDEGKDKDWMWRIHTAQCPDPKGRVVWRIEQRPLGSTEIALASMPQPLAGDLQVSVEEVGGTCTSGMHPGDTALLRGGSLYLPQPFCLYALAATLPLLPAMQRTLDPEDWMANENIVICPDPKGNVLLRIDRHESNR
jgi:uncharacterized repeat protein (TIGR04076 family)